MAHGPLLRPTKIKVGLTKTAAKYRLEEEPEEWAVEIFKQASKELPWLRDHTTDVEIDQTDEARGYAVGRLLVYPMNMHKQAAAGQRKLLSIPLIVRDREIAPLDVFMHEKRAYPMDEEQAQSILFRPGMFVGPAGKGDFGATNLSGQMRPPASDQRYASGSLHKTSSDHKAESLLEAVAPTIGYDRITATLQKIASSPALHAAYERNGTLFSALHTLVERGGTMGKTAAEARQAFKERIIPDVMQFSRGDRAGQYFIKHANTSCYSEQRDILTRAHLQEHLTEAQVDQVDRVGHLTLGLKPVSLQEKIASHRGPQVEAERTGTYCVQHAGRDLEGVVIPKMVSFEGDEIPLQLFVSDEGYAMQEKVAGEYLGDVHLAATFGPAENAAEVSRTGVLTWQNGPYSLATEPMTLITKTAQRAFRDAPAETVYYVKRHRDGAEAWLHEVPGLQKAAHMYDRHYGIPQGMSWVPMQGKSLGRLPERADEGSELSHLKQANRNQVEIRSDGGGTWQMRGHDFVNDFGLMDQRDAEWALACFGVPDATAELLLKTAAKRDEPVKVDAVRDIVYAEDLRQHSLQKVASVLVESPTAQEALQAGPLYAETAVLVSDMGNMDKAASVIIDKETADAILSLEFMTPENMSIYTDYIPDLEQCATKLAEVLIASRLGMEDVKEAAAKNAMTQVSSVLKGLRNLHAKIS